MILNIMLACTKCRRLVDGCSMDEVYGPYVCDECKGVKRETRKISPPATG